MYMYMCALVTLSVDNVEQSVASFRLFLALYCVFKLITYVRVCLLFEPARIYVKIRENKFCININSFLQALSYLKKASKLPS